MTVFSSHKKKKEENGEGEEEEEKGEEEQGRRSCNTESLPDRNRELGPVADRSPRHPCFLVLAACVAHLS